MIDIPTNTTELARELRERAQRVNAVQARVGERLQLRSARWIRLTANDIPEFPRLSEEDLRDLTVCTYQVKVATSYIQDKVARQDDELCDGSATSDSRCSKCLYLGPFALKKQ